MLFRSSSRVAAKLQKLAPYGMTNGILASEGMTQAVLDATGGKGVDVLIDNVGGSVLPESLKMLALKGRLVSVGRLGANVGSLDMDYLALRRHDLRHASPTPQQSDRVPHRSTIASGRYERHPGHP